MFFGSGSPLYRLKPDVLAYFVLNSGRFLFRKQFKSEDVVTSMRAPSTLTALLSELQTRALTFDYYTRCNEVFPIEPLLAKLAAVRGDEYIFKEVDVAGGYATSLDKVPGLALG